MKVLHIITGLTKGGAENTLYRLCIASKNKGIKNYVVSLTNKGEIGQNLETEGIYVYNLNLKKNIFFFFKIFSLKKIIKQIDPDIVQTWMFHSNLIGGIFAKLCNIKKIFWNLRHSNLEFGKSNIFTILIDFILRLFSYFIPYKIITCSYNNIFIYKKKYNRKLDYIYIPNGYDYLSTNINFVINNEKNDSTFKLGMLANYRKQKNFPLLISTLSELKNKITKFHCYLAGERVDKNNNELVQLIRKYKLENNITLLGKINNTEVLFNKIDLHILSSTFGEAFPNSIAESMLYGIPNVSNNIGDSKIIIGENGWVTNSFNSKDLSINILKAYQMRYNDFNKWIKLKENCHKKIIKSYSIEKMVNNYISEWNK